ncbi:MAG: ABC transporter ATP-binding protein [Cyanobacteriota bacterium]|nr:ABC transporter ATP-binding protein [Cyanobacteriota bacterium]
MAQTFVPANNSVETASPSLDVELRQVYKVFSGEPAVKGVDLAIRKGEFFSILGPSGCGKTTLLRAIAGFEVPSAGEVLIQGLPMNEVPPYRRPVNTVFQSYALFNHLTVAENIAFGLKIQKLPKSEVEARVGEALAGVRMESFQNRYPNQLSGGQRQRVALARALVNRPAVVLLDEPLGALDLKLRKEMQVELRKLHRELGLTFVMVTHDQEEALSLSDRIAVIRAGQIEQVGTPSEIYERPRTAFVADFIGDTNLFRARVVERDAALLRAMSDTGLAIAVQAPAYDLPETIAISVRPEKIQLGFEQPTSAENCFEGRLQHVMYLGTRIQFVVELHGGDLLIVVQPNPFGELPQRDRPVYVSWSAKDCLALSCHS